MNDIRDKALEKIRQRGQEQRPPGSSFESERERAKQALRNEVNSLNGQSVKKIAAVNDPQTEDRVLRVAAYCRVSTDDIDQVISIELQKNNYRDMIKANPKWKYAGTYVDDGFSGTNTDHRPAFRLMMRDALAGKIDMIITKSVSRFARNLLDCIGWVRKLKELDPPVQVFFEQEHLNTTDSTSNIILFVLAMVAEEESHMKSEAMLLSLEWRFSRGRFLTPKLLGYDPVRVEDENGNVKKMLVVNPEEAKTVRLIYYMLLSGSTLTEIADTLTELGRETAARRKDGTKNTRWSAKNLSALIRNERYCGDVLARKTWTPNFHDHKSIKNKGKKNKYYQPAHHEAIVTRAQWNAAQHILNSNRFRHSGKYVPLRVVEKGVLTGFISVNLSWNGHEPDEYFRISSIVMGLTDGELATDFGSRHLPEAGRPIAGLTDDSGIQRIARELSAVEKIVKAQIEGTPLPDEEGENDKPFTDGYQVVSGGMFSHSFEPVMIIRRNSVAFSVSVRAKLDAAYIELLFNPVERMLAVRPSDAGNPNAFNWTKSRGATAFCGILFSALGWDPDYTYRVPALFRTRGSETVIFFNLDNYIGKAAKQSEEELPAAEETPAETIPDEDTRGIFFAADDDEETLLTEPYGVLEEKLRIRAEKERRSFGTPAFEHDGGIRLPDDAFWDVTAEARPVSGDYSVDGNIIENLRNDMRRKE